MKSSPLAILVALGIGITGEAVAAAPSDCGTSRIGWALNRDDAEIHTFYWATTDFSELWLTIRPEQPSLGKPGVPELMLVFSICFHGKVMPSPQPSAELRIQVNRNFIAALVPDPSLAITIDNDRRYELTGPEFKHWTEYPFGCNVGDSCVYTAVLVDLPTEVLRRMAGATNVRGTISGTPFELTTEHRRRLRAFINRISGG